MLSKSCEYAIKAMFFIQTNDKNGKSRLQDIAIGINSPIAFTAKILQQLRGSNLLVSTIGARGGFQINPHKKITLFQIVEAIDGNGLFTKCVLGLETCSSEKPCPVHEKYKIIKEEIIGLLKGTSIEDYSERIDNNLLHLI